RRPLPAVGPLHGWSERWTPCSAYDPGMSVPTEAARSPMPRGYEFVKVLGGGGCGWVALANQTALGRLVAVKTLYAGRYDEDERRRLEREGRALARLRDPHIVAVYAMEEVGED